MNSEGASVKSSALPLIWISTRMPLSRWPDIRPDWGSEVRILLTFNLGMVS